jgi:hypothetical protein
MTVADMYYLVESTYSRKDRYFVDPLAGNKALDRLLPSSARYLTTVGFPRSGILGFDFRVSQHVSVEILSYFSDGETPEIRRSSFIRIAENFGAIFGIDISTKDRVLWIDTDRQRPAILVNSSVECLGACIATCAGFRAQVDKKKTIEAAAVLRDSLAHIDADACRSNTWWSSVIEEVGYGLL